MDVARDRIKTTWSAGFTVLKRRAMELKMLSISAMRKIHQGNLWKLRRRPEKQKVLPEVPPKRHSCPSTSECTSQQNQNP
jgi:hypothetical protein